MDRHALLGMATAPLAFNITPLSTVMEWLSISGPWNGPWNTVREVSNGLVVLAPTDQGLIRRGWWRQTASNFSQGGFFAPWGIQNIFVWQTLRDFLGTI